MAGLKRFRGNKRNIQQSTKTNENSKRATEMVQTPVSNGRERVGSEKRKTKRKTKGRLKSTRYWRRMDITESSGGSSPRNNIKSHK